MSLGSLLPFTAVESVTFCRTAAFSYDATKLRACNESPFCSLRVQGLVEKLENSRLQRTADKSSLLALRMLTGE